MAENCKVHDYLAENLEKGEIAQGLSDLKNEVKSCLAEEINQVKVLIESSFVEIDKDIRLYKGFGGRYEERIKKLESNKDSITRNQENPEYLKGLIILKRSRVDLLSVIQSVLPEKIKNYDFLREKIKAIPAKVKNTFNITKREFEDDTSYLEDPEFQRVAAFLFEKGIKKNSYFASKLIEINKATPIFLESIAYLYKNGLKISSYDIKNHLTQEKAQNKTYLENLVKLKRLGFREGRTVETLSLEKGVSKSYMGSVEELIRNGFEINYSFLEYLTLQKGESKTYIENVISLKKRVTNSKKIPGFASIPFEMGAYPKFVDRYLDVVNLGSKHPLSDLYGGDRKT